MAHQTTTTNCLGCGRELDERPAPPPELREPCTECGSTGRHFAANIDVNIGASASLAPTVEIPADTEEVRLYFQPPTSDSPCSMITADHILGDGSHVPIALDLDPDLTQAFLGVAQQILDRLQDEE